MKEKVEVQFLGKESISFGFLGIKGRLEPHSSIFVSEQVANKLKIELGDQVKIVCKKNLEKVVEGTESPKEIKKK